MSQLGRVKDCGGRFRRAGVRNDEQRTRQAHIGLGIEVTLGALTEKISLLYIYSPESIPNIRLSEQYKLCRWLVL